MINLYKKDETTFEHNGLGSLDNNILNPEISWKDNGAFTLEFKYPLFAKHGFEIENSSIIRANDPEGSNLFFVYKITPSMGYVTVLCYQISYKLAFNSINDTNIVNKSGQNALTQMSNATQYPHSFVFSSDIQTTATSRVVRKNPIEFLLDTGLDNSFVNRWGGHIVRHNFNIAMNTAYGSNKGYTIRHRKDLKGYEAEFDESIVITRIRPVGADGLLLPELFVDSPLIDNYTEPRIQEIEYSDVKVKTKDGDEEGFSTKELAYAELRRLANLEFSKNKVDKPDFSAKVEFVNLKETQEYQDLKSLKQVLPGDIVKVIHAEDNFSIEAQMVEYKWNPLNQSYISITLGNYTKSFTSTVSKASSLQTNLSQIAQQAKSAWSAANGKNTVYSLTYKPAITGSSVEGDLLYLKNGDKIEMWILEKVNGELQWVLQVSDATSEELKAQMVQAKTDIVEAVDSANSAVDKANASVTAVRENTQLINDVNEIANNAKSQAQTAATNAQTAITNAQSALEKANGVSSKVTTIETNIDTINGTLSSKANTTDLNTLEGRVSTAESSITQNANDIKLKANQTDVNTTNGKVSSLESSFMVQSGQITALNTKTDGQTTKIGKLENSYNGLTSTISEIQTDVGGKAGKTELSQLSQDLSGFKATVSNTYLSKSDASGTYADKVSVASQITQSATAVTSNVQFWTNNKLTAYSTTQQTATSITNAVASKADKTQITQLSDQITSAVSQLSAENLNFILNGSFQTTENWGYSSGTTINAITNNSSSIPIAAGSYLRAINSNDSYVVSQNASTNVINSLKGKTVTFSGYAKCSSGSSSTFRLYVKVTTSDGSVSYFGSGVNQTVTTAWTRYSMTATFPNDVTDIGWTYNFRDLANVYTYLTGAMTNIGSVLMPYVDSTLSYASQSQITQLASDINLRVSKGDVTSQINLESGRVLIDSKQLLLNADNVKFSGSAFIPNSVIQNLSADKITAGTLNAANVNVINLNARSLTTGTISGSNLSMNLNTGEVLFQKGSIKKIDNKFSIDITNGVIESYNYMGGFTLKSGEISFRDNSILNTSSFEKYGSIVFDWVPGGTFSGVYNGISVRGTDGWAIGTANSVAAGISTGSIGSAIVGSKTSSTWFSQGDITIEAGNVYDNGAFKITPSISIGAGNSPDILITAVTTEVRGNLLARRNLSVIGNLSVTGSKNAVHVTRDGLRATPAYETAESYLGDIGRSYTREDCEIWVEIDPLFSDTVNTDIAYEVFLQAYDNAIFWVEDFRSDKFLVKSNKPMSRFAYEIKAKRRGYENERLVEQEGFDNKMLLDAHAEGAF